MKVTEWTGTQGLDDTAVGFLGPTLASRGGQTVELTAQDGRVLAALVYLSHDGSLVEARVVEEYAWRRPPSNQALRSSIFRLRRALGVEVIQTRRRLVGLGRLRVDLDEFLRRAAAVRADSSVVTAREALAVVRGQPFADCADLPAWRPIIATWVERIEAVRDGLADALAREDQVIEAIAITRLQLAAGPQAAERWTRLVRLLTASERVVEASRAVEDARRSLAEVGLELTPALHEAAAAIVTAQRHQVHSVPVSQPHERPSQPTESEASNPVSTDVILSELGQVLAMGGEALATAELSLLIDATQVDLDSAVAVGCDRGVIAQVGPGIVVADREWAQRQLGLLTAAQRARLATRAIEASVWADPAASHCAIARLRLIEHPRDGWLRSAQEFVASQFPEPVLDSSVVERVLAELIAAPGARHRGHESVLSTLYARRAASLRELGRYAEAADDTAESYRLAVASGDGEAVCEALVIATVPAFDAITDLGVQGDRLARVWRPSASTTRQAAVVDAVLAFHAFARGDSANGQRLGTRVVEFALENLDAPMTRHIVRLVAYELFWDRSFAVEVEEFGTWARAAGDRFSALSTQLYVVCARMRRRTVAFDAPEIDEIIALGRSGRTAIQRAAMLDITRSTLQARPPQLLESALVVEGSVELPDSLVARAVEVFAVLRRDRRWGSVEPVELLGDPRRWHISNPVDAALWAAATATARGDRVAARRALERVAGTAIVESPTVLTPARLPLAALTSARLGDRDMAAALLAANSPLVGSDLCILPAAHFGPAESWLAILAEVAGDPGGADRLHEQAAIRLGQLDGRVLELA